VTPWRAVTARARQPRRKRRPLFTCGRCHKGYSSPFGHACTGGGDLGRRRKAARNAEDRAKATRKRQGTAARRRQAERERIRAVRQAEQEKARRRVAAARAAERARAGRTAAPRAPRQAHDYLRCRDRDCERAACVAYRAGHEAGYETGHEAGYDEGFAAGAATAGSR
jgi:hypothetical protein